MGQFIVWKTLMLGVIAKDAEGFRKAIKDRGMCLGDYANDILGKPAFSVAPEPTEVDVVRVSVEELGFEGETTWDAIYKKAKELGLGLCPYEIGLQLRLQYTDQPKSEWLFIGMEAIPDSEGDLVIFRVGHGDGSL